MYGVVSGRVAKGLAELAKIHRLQLDFPTEQRMLSFFHEVLNDYLAKAFVDPVVLQSVRTKIREILNGRIEGEQAERFLDEWIEQAVGAIDVRFPLLPNLYTVPEWVRPEYDLVMKTIGESQWKKLSKEAKADPVRHYEDSAAVIGRMIAIIPPEHPRLKALTSERDNALTVAAAFKAMQAWEKKVYASIPTAEARGYPYGFAGREEFNGFAQQFSSRFVDDLTKSNEGTIGPGNISLYLHGSSLTGLSHERKNSGLRRPFGPQSDLDFAVVVPDAVFAQLRRKGMISEEEPGKRSIPYSLSATPDALRKMGVEALIREMEPGLAVKKISFSYYSESYAKERREIAPYLPITPVPKLEEN